MSYFYFFWFLFNCLWNGKEKGGSIYITIYCVWSAGMFLSLSRFHSLPSIMNSLWILSSFWCHKNKGCKISLFFSFLLCFRRGKKRERRGEDMGASGKHYTRWKLGRNEEEFFFFLIKEIPHPARSSRFWNTIPRSASTSSSNNSARAFNITWGGQNKIDCFVKPKKDRQSCTKSRIKCFTRSFPSY